MQFFGSLFEELLLAVELLCLGVQAAASYHTLQEGR